MAAGLVASLAFTAASHAGTVTTDTLITTENAKVSDVTATYTSAPSLTDFTVLGTSTVTVTGESISGDSIVITFNPVGGTGLKSAELDFSFAGSDPAISSTGFSVDGKTNVGSGPHGAGIFGTVSYAAVPEPSTMALLGIGMTSFLAFRRFFKRNPVA